MNIRDQLSKLGLFVRGDASSWAAFSPCDKYRYALGRSWALPMFPQPTVLWCAHNPSKAGATNPDPSLQRMVGFSNREGFGSLVLVNEMAFIATKKEDLAAADDPIGPLNAAVRELVASLGLKTIVAWGDVDLKALSAGRPRGWKPSPVHHFLGETWCLGTTIAGQPRHPLYLPGETPLVRWP
jgi:hypothetical protein